MHNLVKESTGIDFNDLVNDVKAAKEITLRALEINLDKKDKCSIEACPSVGHLLNEVSQHHLQYSKSIFLNYLCCCWLPSFSLSF